MPDTLPSTPKPSITYILIQSAIAGSLAFITTFEIAILAHLPDGTKWALLAAASMGAKSALLQLAATYNVTEKVVT